MDSRDLFTTDRIFCPGPTPVPKTALLAQENFALYHRSDEFYKIFLRAADLLKPLFGTNERPVILTSSGTGALEAVMVNLTAADDQVIVVNGGKFGERWEKLARAYQCKVEVVPVEWGQAPSAADIQRALDRAPATKAIFLQANETSTGVYYPVKEIAAELRRRYDGLIIVDSISSLGAHIMKMDAWKIDAVVAGSQKGFGIPAGLGFAALSTSAWTKLSKRPRFYFDLERERKAQATGATAFTPANTLVLALAATLEEINKVGPEGFAEHHAKLAAAARAAAQGMGLALFAKSAPSNALTAMEVPAEVDGSKLVKRLRQRFGMFFAGGQDQLKGKIVRYAHLGFVSRFDLLDGLAALEFALKEEGHRFDLGEGVKSAMRSLA